MRVRYAIFPSPEAAIAHTRTIRNPGALFRMVKMKNIDENQKMSEIIKKLRLALVDDPTPFMKVWGSLEQIRASYEQAQRD